MVPRTETKLRSTSPTEISLFCLILVDVMQANSGIGVDAILAIAFDKYEIEYLEQESAFIHISKTDSRLMMLGSIAGVGSRALRFQFRVRKQLPRFEAKDMLNDDLKYIYG